MGEGQHSEGYGPWRCRHFGLVWTGDINNHHGIESPGFCPGPHVRDTEGLFLRALNKGWTLHADGNLTPPHTGEVDA